MLRNTRETWMAYAECFVFALPLRECAARCGVGLKTAWTMRHRLIECLRAYSPGFHVGKGQGCELDETYFRESFKGNHSKGAFAIPRKARRRGGGVHERGLSREQVCVMTGVGDDGTAFLEVAGRGTLSAERAAGCLRGRVGAGAAVATDKARAYPPALRELGVAEHAALDSRDRSKGAINGVNALHSSLKSFMARFRGVSTKRLQSYLDWFLWCRTFMSADALAAERTVARQLAGGSCETRVRDMFGVRPPLMGYWGGRCAPAH